MIKYSLAMGIRVACLLCLPFVEGWWLLVMGLGALVLPWFAVVIANVGSNPPGALESPGGELLPAGSPAPRPRHRETGGRPE